MADLACPLCRDSAKMRRPRVIYGHQVCTRCWARFITRRQVAWILDVFFIDFVAGFLLGFVVALAAPGTKPSGWFLVAALYGLLFLKDGFRGHSLGKPICGVQVVDRDSGQAAGFAKSFLRNWIMVVPFMPLVVALTMNKGPRIGDGMARTRVIWKRYRDHPVFSHPAAVAKVFE